MQAYVASRTAPDERTQALALVTSSFGLGTVIGPALAPLMVVPVLGLTGPFAAFSLCGIAILIALRIGLPDGAFYAFFAVDGITDSLAVAKDIVRTAKVGLAPGIAFGPESQGFLRMCYASKPDRLGAALDRLEDFIGKL